MSNTKERKLTRLLPHLKLETSFSTCKMTSSISALNKKLVMRHLNQTQELTSNSISLLLHGKFEKHET